MESSSESRRSKRSQTLSARAFNMKAQEGAVFKKVSKKVSGGPRGADSASSSGFSSKRPQKKKVRRQEEANEPVREQKASMELCSSLGASRDDEELVSQSKEDATDSGALGFTGSESVGANGSASDSEFVPDRAASSSKPPVVHSILKNVATQAVEHPSSSTDAPERPDGKKSTGRTHSFEERFPTEGKFGVMLRGSTDDPKYSFSFPVRRIVAEQMILLPKAVVTSKDFPTSAFIEKIVQRMVLLHEVPVGNPRLHQSERLRKALREICLDCLRVKKILTEPRLEALQKTLNWTGERKVGVTYMLHSIGSPGVQYNEDYLWKEYLLAFEAAETVWLENLRKWKSSWATTDSSDKPQPSVSEVRNSFKLETMANRASSNALAAEMSANVLANTKMQENKSAALYAIVTRTAYSVAESRIRWQRNGWDVDELDRMAVQIMQQIHSLSFSPQLINTAPSTRKVRFSDDNTEFSIASASSTPVLLTPVPSTPRSDLEDSDQASYSGFSGTNMGNSILDNNNDMDVEITGHSPPGTINVPTFRVACQTHVRHDWTDEQVERWAIQCYSDAMDARKEAMKNGKKVGTEPSLERWRKDLFETRRRRHLKHQLLHNPKECIVVECGGGGHCGPLSFIAGMGALGIDVAQLTVEELREKVKKAYEFAKPDNDRDTDYPWDTDWWNPLDFKLAAQAYQLDVFIITSFPRRFTTMVEEAQYGSRHDGSDTILIFGGKEETASARHKRLNGNGKALPTNGNRDSQTTTASGARNVPHEPVELKGEGHWRLLLIKPTKAQLAGFRSSKTTLANAWKACGADLDKLKREESEEGVDLSSFLTSSSSSAVSSFNTL